MADIGKAAEWMEEGFAVQRKEFKDGPNDEYHATEDGDIVNQNIESLVFTLGDLLAQDWELVQPQGATSDKRETEKGNCISGIRETTDGSVDGLR